jgi:hypothetical protein
VAMVDQALHDAGYMHFPRASVSKGKKEGWRLYRERVKDPGPPARTPRRSGR